MFDYKTVISIIAVLLTFGGYAPYIRDVLQKKTTPHAFTWFVWTLASAIACALQISGGAGPGAWVTLAVVLICLLIFVLSLRNGHKDITRTDVVFLILSLMALGLWLVAKLPIWSNILIVTVDVLGFAPTIRKSWSKPYSETLVTYKITALRHGLSIFAQQQYNILTTLYPVAWTAANALFSLLLILRRRVIPRENRP
ncbi:MAG TPA: hypothetical protein VEA59_00545 [Patescibacteria group bacterium]|nr:hypothetical protein [Patescibacteria group bacterium]